MFMKNVFYAFFITTFILQEFSSDACSITVDVLSMIDLELGALDDDKGRDKFINLVSSAKVKSIVAIIFFFTLK